MFQLQAKHRGEQTAYADEMIENQSVVSAFSYNEKAKEEFDVLNDRLADSSLKATFYSSITNPTTRFVNSLIYSGVGVAGAILAIFGGITVGGLTSFLGYASQYAKPFNEISGVVTELQNAIACAARILRSLMHRQWRRAGKIICRMWKERSYLRMWRFPMIRANRSLST